MNEQTDLASLAVTPGRGRPGGTGPSPLGAREADIVAYRLVELQCAPIRGGFDAAHLQNIHRYIYQGLYDWAGELRRPDAVDLTESDMERALDRVLDRLSADNCLRGLIPDDWTGKAVEYIGELDALKPFVDGNDIALREFAVELARKNQIGLHWDASSPIADETAITAVEQAAQSANLRRIVMLAMDKDTRTMGLSRGDTLNHTIERSLPDTTHMFER